jgi:hypothetical protein
MIDSGKRRHIIKIPPTGKVLVVIGVYDRQEQRKCQQEQDGGPPFCKPALDKRNTEGSEGLTLVQDEHGGHRGLRARPPCGRAGDTEERFM